MHNLPVIYELRILYLLHSVPNFIYSSLNKESLNLETLMYNKNLKIWDSKHDLLNARSRNSVNSTGCLLRQKIQSPAFNVTHFESRITYLSYTAINTTEHG
jgi:hypothetical protein